MFVAPLPVLCLLSLAPIDSSQHTLSRDRQIGDVDTQRVERIANSGWHWWQRGLTQPMHLAPPSLQQVIRHIGYITSNRNVVVGEVGVGDLPVLEGDVLKECGTQAHDHSAF